MQFSLRYINVFNDINSENIAEIKQFYSEADLRLTAKFKLPNFADGQEYNESVKNIAKFDAESISKHLMNYAYISKEVAEALASDMEAELKILLPSENAIRSAYAKIAFWVKTEFNSVLNDRTSTIYAELTPNKYELYMLYLASKLSNNIVIVDRKLDKKQYKLYNNFQFNEYAEIEGLSLENYVETAKSNLDIDSVCKKMSGKEVRSGEKILVLGVGEQNKVYNKLAELDENTPDNVMLLRLGVAKASTSEIAKVHRPEATSIKQLVNMIGQHMFAGLAEKEKAVAFIKAQVSTETNVSVAISRLTSFICISNRYRMDFDTMIVFGDIHKSTKWYMDFLGYIGKQVIVVDFSGKSAEKVDNTWNTIVIGEFREGIQYPTKVKADTVAYKASKEIDKLLYSGDTPGLYRANQFSKCEAVNLKTTFEELKILWNVENTARPFFSNTEDTVKLPVIYSKLFGVCDKYTEELGEFVAEHTIICYNSMDIMNLICNNIMVKDYSLYSCGQRLAVRLADNKELNIQNIVSCQMYPYSHLTDKVQHTIMTGLRQLVQEMTLGQDKNITKMIDSIVEVGLNLSPRVYQEMQWHDFTKHNPKLIVMLPTETSIDIKVEILIKLLHLCGWDIIIVIPTGYNLIQDTNIQSHTIGEFKFDCSINHIERVQKQKQSLFSRLFR